VVARILVVGMLGMSVLIPAAIASPRSAPFVQLNVTPAITLTPERPRVFTTAAAPTGTVIACLSHGQKAEMKVPPAGSSGVQSSGSLSWRKKRDGSTQLIVPPHIIIFSSVSRIYVICT
jgi:hypothetical protein